MGSSLKDINAFGREEGVPIILDDSLALLISTLKSSNAKNVLEIGTAIGYSAIAMATNCNVERITSLEIDENRVQIAQKNIDNNNLGEKITIIHTDAGQWLEHATGQYDFVFLDGPKGQYVKYLPNLLKLIPKGGIIFADNVFFKGMVKGDIPTPKSLKTIINNLKKYLEYVTCDKSMLTELHDIGDGVAISKVL